MGVINYSKCHFCPEENQTEEHMLFNCPVVKSFWNLVRLKYVNIFRTPITEYEAIIGAADENYQLRLRKNVILLHARMEIYSANNKKKNLDIEKLEMKISDHYKLESANNSEKRHFIPIQNLCLYISGLF